MPNPAVQPLFDRARALGIGFYVGYAELTPRGRSASTPRSSSMPDGAIIGKYRKVHLPGLGASRAAGARYQQLEKRYFEYGDLGFPAFRAAPDGARHGHVICNDRRWPETWRVLGLQGVGAGLRRLQLRRLRPQWRRRPRTRSCAPSTPRWPCRPTPT